MWRSIAALVTTLGIVMLMWFQSPLYNEQTALPVSTVQVRASAINSSIISRGRIEDAGQNEVYTKNPVRVVAVHVEIGDTVEAGQPLFTAENTTDEVVPDADKINDMLEGGISEEAVLSVFNYLTGSDPSASSASDGAAVYTQGETEQDIYEVISPVSGVVTQLSLKENAVISPSSSGITLSDPSKLRVLASVSEMYVQDIAVGMRAKITGDAFRDRVYSGRVTKILPYARQNTSLSGTSETVVDIWIDIDQPDAHLLPGFSTQVEILNDYKSNALLIPYESIYQDAQNRECVYTVRNDRVYSTVIETGYELEDSIEVTSGLEAGDMVVLNPEKMLADGVRVKAGEG